MAHTAPKAEEIMRVAVALLWRARSTPPGAPPPHPTEEHHVSHYLPPGQPIPPTPPARANTYLTPTAVAQQMHAPPDPTPQAALAAGNGTDVPRHSALLNEWRRRHGREWIRADDLSATVRQMIDGKGRIPAIRQKLRQLVAVCPELQTMVRGNRARQVVLYRLARIETTGLEG